jgi:hypothetical protein
VIEKEIGFEMNGLASHHAINAPEVPAGRQAGERMPEVSMRWMVKCTAQ